MSGTFEAAVTRYQDFLASNGYPRAVRWVTESDVLVCNRPLVYIKVPVPAENEREARRSFATGTDEKRGVLFETLGCDQETTYAFAWVPRDDDEAIRHMMPDGIKLSVRTRQLPARAINSRLRWRYLRWKHREHQSLKHSLFRGD